MTRYILKVGDAHALTLTNVAQVTGTAPDGIGRASALTFAMEEANVVVADVDVEGAEETVDMIKKAGGKAIFVKTRCIASSRGAVSG